MSVKRGFQMLVEAHALHYSAYCESCGNHIEISYSSFRRVLNGSVPDEGFLRHALICVCELPKSGRRRVEERSSKTKVH